MVRPSRVERSPLAMARRVVRGFLGVDARIGEAVDEHRPRPAATMHRTISTVRAPCEGIGRNRLRGLPRDRKRGKDGVRA